MRKRRVAGIAVAVAVWALGGGRAGAQPVVGPVGAFPTTVPVAVGTPVRVTAVITDPSVIAASVILQRIDGAGRVVGTLGAMVDDGTAGDVTVGDRTYTIRPTLYEQAPGSVRLRASAAFQGRLTRVVSAPVSVTVTGASATVRITEPANLAYLNVSPTQVRGTVGDPNASVLINGVTAPVNATDQTFTAQVPLLEGTNTLSAVATNSNGAVTTATVQVTLDTTPPQVHIDTPVAEFVTSAATVSVGGLVNDIVVGTVNAGDATVRVNGVAAAVANRSFFVGNLPLALGANTLQAVATDRSGNSATTAITVTRVPVTGGAIARVSGDQQTGPAGSVLPQALVVQVTDAGGQPAGNQTVVFRVVENSGGLVSGTSRLGALAVVTGADGRAAASLQLGARSGVGNNVVEAEATGFAGTAVFTASGTPTAASQIVVDTGNGQTGVVGQVLPLPFIAIVTDAGFNRLANVPVTFTVRQGGGQISGKPAFTAMSDSDGRVAAVLTLGQQEGYDNNVVEATFAGQTGLPAAFLASARVPGDASLTRITGVVLDNSNQPIEGVTLRLFRTHHGTGLAEQVVAPVQTDEGGTFAIQPAPVGAFKLMADGSTAANGPWPTLEFDIVTVAGQINDVGLPIYLPRLEMSNALCVNETTGGTLTLPQVPGFALTIVAGGATFPGGARSGCVTVTPVNGDKVPMSPGFGQQPRFVVTIQPVGTIFNPPAQLTLPNVDGLAPRAVTEMYSYDHDLAAFVAIGTGTVSEDGSVIVSDPGVGVIKAGWHCGGNPNPVGSAGTCPTCQKCQGTQCVTDNSQTPPQSSPTDCRKEVCQGGAVSTQNDDSEQPTDVCERCSGGSAVDRADGSTPADANSCCFQGEQLNKYGQELGILFDGALVEKCPMRTQDTVTGGPFGNGLHSVDGCSGGVPPNIQDPMTNLPYPFGLLNQAPTAFGVPIGGGATGVGAGAVGAQPCNQHDLCYQTCDPTSGSAQFSSGREACDDAMSARMDAVCEVAYPATCPSTLGVAECVSYHLQRLDCFTYSDLYWAGLRAGGASAYAERQQQFCKCCP
jgi:hypothetical protein